MKKQIQEFGSGELRLLDGESFNLDELDFFRFRDMVSGKYFKVSIKPLSYYIRYKQGFRKDSDVFKGIVEKINKDPYEALSNNIIKKGNCYSLNEVQVLSKASHDY